MSRVPGSRRLFTLSLGLVRQLGSTAVSRTSRATRDAIQELDGLKALTNEMSLAQVQTLKS